MIRTIQRLTAVDRSVRVMQAESLFDLPPAERSEQVWEVHLPIEDRDWNVGLIVGPSGAGKSTVARECFGRSVYGNPKWSSTKSLLDCFPASMPTDEITKLLSAVGLGSIPAWVRPYSTLSTGEQFRARVARALAESDGTVVIDEWTSTVDRQVGRVTSAATAKAVRRRGTRLVAVTCHYDVLEWLQPDWVYQPHADDFVWRSVQPRPQITVDIAPLDRAAWRVFHKHHYLTSQLPPGEYFGGFVEGECIAFAGMAHVIHPSKKVRNMRRIARTVTLPDWQGIGLGGAFFDEVAAIQARRGLRVRASMAHPGLIRHCLSSPRWFDVTPKLSMQTGPHAMPGLAKAAHNLRRIVVRTFEFSLPL